MRNVLIEVISELVYGQTIRRNILFEVFSALINTPIINRDYQVPYLAGYSKDGRFIYIDMRLPKFLKLKNGRVIDVDKYLLVHERFEKMLEDYFGYDYRYAHEMATGMERKAVEADGIDWDEYQHWMKKMVKILINFEGPLPPDLDLKPEKDYHDYRLLKKIRRIQKSISKFRAA